MAVSQGSILVLVLSIALTVDYARSQAYGATPPTPPTPPTGPTAPYGAGTAPTTLAASTPEPGEMPEETTTSTAATTTTTTTTTTTKKPKHRRRPKSRKRRPKNLKPRPKGRRRGKGKQAAVKPAPKPKSRVTTRKPTTAPTIATTTTRAPATPVPAPTPAPAPVPTVHTVQPVTAAPIVGQPAQGAQGAGQYAASANNAYGPQPQQVKVVQHPYQHTVRATASTTKSPSQYLYDPHSCPKMDVATWENEVVIYDNKNCAIIVRMNPRLRRPTVTFQAPYW